MNINDLLSDYVEPRKIEVLNFPDDISPEVFLNRIVFFPGRPDIPVCPVRWSAPLKFSGSANLPKIVRYWPGSAAL